MCFRVIFRVRRETLTLKHICIAGLYPDTFGVTFFYLVT